MNIGRADISAFEADEMARRAYSQGWKDGKYTALDAALEAVLSLKKHVEFHGAPVNYIHPDFFIAAIDALKEKP